MVGVCFDEDVVRCAAGSGVALRSFVIEVKPALWSNGPRDLAQGASPGNGDEIHPHHRRGLKGRRRGR